ncbi:uncharacterized protein [Clytia hemisphaerica]
MDGSPNKTSKKKRFVASNEIKTLVRDTLKEESGKEGFKPWILTETNPFTEANRELSKRILELVKGTSPETSSEEITNAIHIRFKSIRDTNRRRGKNPNYKKDMAKKSRKDQKLLTRITTLNDSTLDSCSKKLWRKIVTIDMVSSDEDEVDGDVKTFIVRKPTWRPKQIDQLFEVLDNHHDKSRSQRSKFQSYKRVLGPDSLRPEPDWSGSQLTAMKKLDLIPSHNEDE